MTLLDDREHVDLQIFSAHPALTVNGTRRYLEDYHSWYVRPYQTATAIHLADWLDEAEALVVNRPSAMQSNASKPYQLQLIRQVGLRTPDTLVTNSRTEAREFIASHHRVVYKSVSGVRSIVSTLRPIDARLKGNRLLACPTLFQEWIPGPDLRMHVIGDQVFSVLIESACDDYRYASRSGASVTLRPWVAEATLEQAAMVITRQLGLHISGIDFRRDHEGAWYCFEVNPSPAFTYYDTALGGRMTQALSRLLAGLQD